MELTFLYENCKICPRKCNVNRSSGQKGACQVGAELKIARAALHHWEEPCISGTGGSGAVFFAGCSLHCVFCQNEKISHGMVGKEISVERLAEIFLELQDKGAHNINLVTPTQYVPSIVTAVEGAKDQGLIIPLVYNTSAYESVETLRRLEGIVDIYLPDFKYMDPKLAAQYSGAPDYPQVAKAAIAEMVRQQPKPCFAMSSDEEGNEREQNAVGAEKETSEYRDGMLMLRGVMVRQLLLPNALADAKKIIQYLHAEYGDQIYLSLMSQYTPLDQVAEDPVLSKRVSQEAYQEYLNYAIRLKIGRAFVQEGEVAEESFIPYFDCEGV